MFPNFLSNSLYTVEYYHYFLCIIKALASFADPFNPEKLKKFKFSKKSKTNKLKLYQYYNPLQ